MSRILSFTANPVDPKTALRLTVGGLALAALGLALIGAWGDVVELQRATSSSGFASIAEQRTNSVRWSGLADFAIFVPGNSAFIIGLLALFRSPRGPLGSRKLSSMGSKSVLIAAVADQVENITVQLSLGLVELTNPGPNEVVNPSGWLIGLLRVSNLVKWVFLAGAFVALAGLVFFSIRRRFAPSSGCD